MFARLEIPAGALVQKQWMLGCEDDRVNFADRALTNQSPRGDERAAVAKIELRADNTLILLRQALDPIQFLESRADWFVRNDMLARFKRRDDDLAALSEVISHRHRIARHAHEHLAPIPMRQLNLSLARKLLDRLVMILRRRDDFDRRVRSRRVVDAHHVAVTKAQERQSQSLITHVRF